MQPNVRNPQWQFEQLGNPGAWLCQADLLKESADVLLSHGRGLWESIGRHAKPGESIPNLSVDQSVVMYLYALAIENLLKGIIIARNPTKLDTGKVTWSGDGHRLCELWSQANVSFKDAHDEHLVRQHFQHFLDWGGRYPIPKDKDKLTKSPLFYEQFQSEDDFLPVYESLRQVLVGEIGNTSGP